MLTKTKENEQQEELNDIKTIGESEFKVIETEPEEMKQKQEINEILQQRDTLMKLVQEIDNCNSIDQQFIKTTFDENITLTNENVNLKKIISRLEKKNNRQMNDLLNKIKHKLPEDFTFNNEHIDASETILEIIEKLVKNKTTNRYNTLLMQYEKLIQIINNGPKDAVNIDYREQIKAFTDLVNEEQMKQSPFKELFCLYSTLAYANKSKTTTCYEPTQEMNELKATLSNQQQKIDKLNNEISKISLKTKPSDFFTSVERIICNYKKVIKENTRLRSDLINMKEDIKAKTNELKEILQNETEKQKNFAELIQDQLNDTLKETGNILTSKHEEEKYQKKAEELEKQVYLLKNQLSKGKQNYEELKKENISLINKVEEKKKDNEYLKSKLNSMTKSKKLYKDKGEELSSQVNNLINKIDEIEAANSKKILSIQTIYETRIKEILKRAEEAEKELSIIALSNEDPKKEKARNSMLNITIKRQKEDIKKLEQNNNNLIAKMNYNNKENTRLLQEEINKNEMIKKQLEILIKKRFGLEHEKENTLELLATLDSLIGAAYKTPLNDIDDEKEQMLIEEIESLKKQVSEKDRYKSIAKEWRTWSQEKLIQLKASFCSNATDEWLKKTLDIFLYNTNNDLIRMNKSLRILKEEKKYLCSSSLKVQSQQSREGTLRTLTLMLIFLNKIKQGNARI